MSQQSGRSTRATHLLPILVSMGALLLCSCTTPDAVTGLGTYNLYTIQNDVEVGQTAMASNLEQLQQSGVRINADPVRTAQINNIMR